MLTVLVFNPGSNSLKFELIQVRDDQSVASDGKTLLAAAIDGIGAKTAFTVDGKKDTTVDDLKIGNVKEAVSASLKWLRRGESFRNALHDLTFVGIRVVHGGAKYGRAARLTQEVRDDIAALEDLAPLHNRSSLDVISTLKTELPSTPIFVTFDTAFHRTIPEKAWRYPIDRHTADRYGIRKYGFHGLSHRFMLEQYAQTVGKATHEVNLVTLHLESGSSACAIQGGRSVDTTMGLTPLEGLMMGSRSGSIDPAILPFLMRKEKKGPDEIMTFLNKRSGLLGIAGDSLDTRDLARRSDPPAKLALEMFSYRVRLAVGAYLAALGRVDAVLFGGGIGENSPWLRKAVCSGLEGWGLKLDIVANGSTEGTRRITLERSHLHAWAIAVDEGLQIAHECLEARRDIS